MGITNLHCHCALTKWTRTGQTTIMRVLKVNAASRAICAC